VFHLFQPRLFRSGSFGGFGVGDEPPDESGCGEEDGGEEGRVVVPELGDERGGGEGTGRSGDLVENVNDSIHSSKLSIVWMRRYQYPQSQEIEPDTTCRQTHPLNIPSDDVPGNDPPYQLDHPISHPTDDIDGEQPVRVPRPVLLLPSVQDLGFPTGRRVADQEGHADKSEGENSIGQYGTGRESFDERGDEDRADLCQGMVPENVSSR
jgi:hypothetical protein